MYLEHLGKAARFDCEIWRRADRPDDIPGHRDRAEDRLSVPIRLAQSFRHGRVRTARLGQISRQRTVRHNLARQGGRLRRLLQDRSYRRLGRHLDPAHRPTANCPLGLRDSCHRLRKRARARSRSNPIAGYHSRPVVLLQFYRAEFQDDRSYSRRFAGGPIARQRSSPREF